MDFDHRDPALKLFNISEYGVKCALAVLIAEIAKCDVVCANCHRQRTHEAHTGAIEGRELHAIAPSRQLHRMATIKVVS
jgi:hypothetical protein